RSLSPASHRDRALESAPGRRKAVATEKGKGLGQNPQAGHARLSEGAAGFAAEKLKPPIQPKASASRPQGGSYPQIRSQGIGPREGSWGVGTAFATLIKTEQVCNANQGDCPQVVWSGTN